MNAGLSTRLFIEDGPFAQAARLEASRSTARSWHILSAESRLAAVENALCPTFDCDLALPHAL